ncbi:MAG: hypothetical protein ABIN37_08050 [Burkholderiaceae bacterium]
MTDQSRAGGSTSTTLAPRESRSAAVTLPMPFAAPVTTPIQPSTVWLM